jgi:hypothetical protein
MRAMLDHLKMNSSLSQKPINYNEIGDGTETEAGGFVEIFQR